MDGSLRKNKLKIDRELDGRLSEIRETIDDFKEESEFTRIQ